MRMRAEIIDGTDLRKDQRVNVCDEGVTSIVPAAVSGAQVTHEIKLDAAAAAQLVHVSRLKQSNRISV